MPRFTIHTPETCAAEAASRWHEQYKNWKHDAEKMQVGKALDALGPKPAAADVNRVIGNDSWTRVRCDACRKNVALVVSFSTDEGGASLCRRCLRDMVIVVKAHQ